MSDMTDLSMMRTCQRKLTLLAVLGVLGVWAAVLPAPTFAQSAQNMKDPTVPPPAWLAAQPAAAGTGAAAAAQAVAPPARVQVLVVGKSRHVALVDGKVIQPGDALGDSQVAAIRASGVEMVDAGKSLDMTPNVEKKRPANVQFRKKIVIPEDGVSSQQTGSKQ